MDSVAFGMPMRICSRSADSAREPSFPVVQGLIRISGPPNGLKQRGQDVCQLASLVWIARHRLQIRIGIPNATESIGLKDRFNLGWFQP